MIKKIIILVIMLSLTGCAAKILDKKEKQLPQKRTSVYDKILIDYGKSLGVFIQGEGSSSLIIQVKDIYNRTSENKLPMIISGMVNTALTKIGYPLIISAYDPDYYINDTNSQGNIKRVLPQILLEGEISEFDTEHKEGEDIGADVAFGGGWSSVDASVDYGQDLEKSSMALDLRAMSYQSQTYISYGTVTNKITLFKQGASAGFGLYIAGNGLNYSSTVQEEHGRHDALRILSYYSVIQFVGRTTFFPYWKMLGIAKDTQIEQAVRREYRQQMEDKRIRRMQALLVLYGYDLPINGIWSEEFVNALKQISLVYNFDTHNLLNVKNYMKLYNDLPVGAYTSPKTDRVHALISGKFPTNNNNYLHELMDKYGKNESESYIPPKVERGKQSPADVMLIKILK